MKLFIITCCYVQQSDNSDLEKIFLTILGSILAIFLSYIIKIFRDNFVTDDKTIGEIAASCDMLKHYAIKTETYLITNYLYAKTYSISPATGDFELFKEFALKYLKLHEEAQDKYHLCKAKMSKHINNLCRYNETLREKINPFFERLDHPSFRKFEEYVKADLTKQEIQVQYDLLNNGIKEYIMTTGVGKQIEEIKKIVNQRPKWRFF
jgi:hypothetical protein